MATYSSILAWRIPGTEEPGGLPSMGSHRVGHYWRNLAAAAAALREPISYSSLPTSNPRAWLFTTLCSSTPQRCYTCFWAYACYLLILYLSMLFLEQKSHIKLWDSPGKNTGVGCHFLLQCMKVNSESEVAQSCLTLSNPMDCSLPSSSVHGIFQARVLESGAIAFSIL